MGIPRERRALKTGGIFEQVDVFGIVHIGHPGACIRCGHSRDGASGGRHGACHRRNCTGDGRVRLGRRYCAKFYCCVGFVYRAGIFGQGMFRFMCHEDAFLGLWSAPVSEAAWSGNIGQRYMPDAGRGLYCTRFLLRSKPFLPLLFLPILSPAFLSKSPTQKGSLCE